MNWLNHATDCLRGHLAGYTIAGICLSLFILTALEYYHIWKQGQRKLNAQPKELDSFQIIQGFVRKESKCGCNGLITCVPCGDRLGRVDEEIDQK